MFNVCFIFYNVVSQHNLILKVAVYFSTCVSS